jgi:hypothetical protein
VVEHNAQVVAADALDGLRIEAEQALVADALVVEGRQHDRGLHASLHGMAHQRDGIGNIGLRGAGQQALRIDA